MTPTQPYFFLQPIDCIQRMDGASWSEKVKAILSNGQQEVLQKTGSTQLWQEGIRTPKAINTLFVSIKEILERNLIQQ